MCYVKTRNWNLLSVLFCVCLSHCSKRLILLCWLLCRDNDLSSIPERYSFSVDHVAYGQCLTHDLKPGGRHVAVTEQNKLEYTQ